MYICQHYRTETMSERGGVGGGGGGGDPRLIRRCVVINIFTNVGTLVSFTLFVKTITVSR